jgi:uncharacterized membrane protein YccF (DUF307 family)
MGCLMNLLWLLLGGIFTAVEYLISSIPKIRKQSQWQSQLQ